MRDIEASEGEAVMERASFWKQWGAFLNQMRQAPREVGAIAPSSEALARFIIDHARVDSVSSVVELGPGDGIFTREIAKRVRPGTVFFALEINPEFAKLTKERCPEVKVYNASAEDIGFYLKQHGLDRCDRIISGLPWATFDIELQNRLIEAIYDSLNPGGEFVTFAYFYAPIWPLARHFRELLEKRFFEVKKTKTILRNAPPAFLYCCKKGEVCKSNQE